MRNQLNIYFHLRNKHLIYCRIETGNTREEVPTKLSLSKNPLTGAKLSKSLVWGGPLDLVKGGSNEAYRMNEELRKIHTRLVTLFKPFQIGMPITAKKLRSLYEGDVIQDQSYSLIWSIDHYVSEMIKAGKHRPGTSKIYQHLRNHLMNFLRKNHNAEDIPLLNFTRSIARDFKSYLESDPQKKAQTCNHYCQLLKAVIHFIIDEYPNDEYPEVPLINVMSSVTKRPPSSKTNSRENFVDLRYERELFNLDLTGSLSLARYMCLWQWNTGFSFVDLGGNPTFDIRKTIDKKSMIYYQRVKTSDNPDPIEAIVPIYEETRQLIEIFENWPEKVEGNFFPIEKWIIEKNGVIQADYNKHKRNYEKYRRNLIKISKLIPISNKSHSYRHTFGVKMSLKGHSLDTISRMLGHKSVKMTESVYVPITGDKITREQEIIQNQSKHG